MLQRLLILTREFLSSFIGVRTGYYHPTTVVVYVWSFSCQTAKQAKGFRLLVLLSNTERARGGLLALLSTSTDARGAPIPVWGGVHASPFGRDWTLLLFIGEFGKELCLVEVNSTK